MGRNILKSPERETVAALEELPNIGPAMARDLHLLGIMHPRELIGKDPLQLYEELCRRTGRRHDPCVLDVFISAVHFMEGGEASPWWSFTCERKRCIAQRAKKK